ncbi:MAG: hypothetical protein H7Z73_10410 [Candidatus Saccharibacteria bacterium]|nr:hypothetical protein [Moraxellaceae bacterium]
MSKKDKALAYAAHRSTWGGRSIQFFDVPSSSTIWDELRRIKENSGDHCRLGSDGTELHKYAIRNEYFNFLKILLVMQSGEFDRVNVLYSVNENGDKRLSGLRIDNEVFKTHIKQWKIQPKI